MNHRKKRKTQKMDNIHEIDNSKLSFVTAMLGFFTALLGLVSAGLQFPGTTGNDVVSFVVSLVLAVLFVVCLLLLYSILKKREKFYRHELNEREEFIQFIASLYTLKHGNSKGFSLLPKICIYLHNKKVVNPIHISELKMTYTGDLSKYDNGKEAFVFESNNGPMMEYIDTQEYEMMVKNNNLPPKYEYCVGNVYANKVKNFQQKHGNSQVYSDVYPAERSKIGAKPYIKPYPWVLDKGIIGSNREIPINFKIEFEEREKARSKTVIDIYPKRYGESIDKIIVNLIYKSDFDVLKSAALYKITKDDRSENGYDSVAISNAVSFKKRNEMKIEFEPDCGWTSGYYILVELEVPVTKCQKQVNGECPHDCPFYSQCSK